MSSTSAMRGDDASPTASTARRTATLVGRLIPPALFAVFAAAFFVGVRDLALESRALPQIVSVLVVSACVLDLVREVRGWARTRGDGVANDDHRKVMDAWPKLAATVALTTVYIVAIGRVGFYTSSIIFLVALLAVLGVRRPLVLGAVTVGFTAVTYLLFTVLLGVPVPSGVLF